MAFFTGYFDESYSQEPKPLVYTVAGYVSTDEKWAKFQEKWQAVLDRENLPPFSMKDIANANKNKNYKGWTKAKIESFLKELHAIIKETYLCGFSVTVIVKDYLALTDKIKYELGTPHTLAMVKCMKLIETWANEENLKEPIHYVFEKGARDNKLLKIHFTDILTDEIQSRYRISSFTFADKTLTPLQAADILAYETRKDISRRYPTEKPREMRKSLSDSLMDWRRNRWDILDRNFFEWFANHPSIKDIPDTDEYKARVQKGIKKWLS